jgi:hypothetical protein
LPGSSTFHRTFAEESNFDGYEPDSVLPLSKGPRQRGQLAVFSARTIAVMLSIDAKMNPSSRYFMMFCSDFQQKLGLRLPA